MTALNRITADRIDDTACQRYRDEGYLLADGVFSGAEVDALNDEALAVCRGQRGPIDRWEGPHDHETDEQVLNRYLCIHFPHKQSELMCDTMKDRRIAHLLTRLIGPNVKCMQSMLFIKAAGKPGQAWHQDEFYIPTRDRSLVGAWIALDDATLSNGCLWVIPGSNKHGVLWPQHEQADPRFDCGGESEGYPYTDDDAVPVEVKKGGVLFFNGYLLHRSLPNTSARGYRRVLVNHYMSAESLLPWHPPKQGEAMGTLDSRDVVMVAGKDPYAYKGVEDLASPHVRPTGEGGCQQWVEDAKDIAQ